MNNEKEIFKAVESINEELLERELGDMIDDYSVYEFLLTISSNTISTFVEFLGQTIYRNDEDEREFLEEGQDYEPLEPYLKKQMKIVLENMSYFFGDI